MQHCSECLPITVVGDLHGQLADLRKIIDRCGDPVKNTYVFLGDYVDRGTQGLELAILLFSYQVRYPDRVFLLRGNHEDINTTSTYGFYDECMMKYGRYGEWVYLMVINAFNHLPLAALIGGRVLCMHGGLSPHIQTLEDIERPGWSLSCRGISFSFDETVVEQFCQKHGIDLIVRAHQITGEMIRGGHRMFAGGRLVTIFSAPNYQNMMNDSCVLRIKKNFVVNFLIFRPVARRRQLTLPRRQSMQSYLVRC
ncbi:Ser/Thr phosphatase family protein [Oesophagostomum dentatum]|uniref:Serine/threonine-protein phosphatase n=1 Tax=Oesophagostomum dentatum TaxID=61180 RepID=A0A0B1TEE4_OESDE|nr:Ser/Thr phosphatase family protein [Oesophagostomum dentatum]